MCQVSDFVLYFFSVLVSLEVEITPSHGEISLGESKFFMCEGEFIKYSIFNLYKPANYDFLVFIFFFNSVKHT